ncbi:hypothetical protein [Acidovorax sp. 1608163]|uniref:hypothetical protein n=1 Tax=Acidovorax sp. 1608163 TaxID=2478662 RepID=UPI0013CEFDB9|nr:hypothetical protein [Acidovorax sp. 1608163]
MKKTIASVWGLAACVAVLSAGQAAAQPREADLSPHEALRAASAQRAAQRSGIEQERKQNLAQRKQTEVKCYRLFAVEDCLRDARNEWRQVETRLRAQEVQINDAERKEKAQERLRQIEDKQSSVADAAGPAGAASAASATVRNPPQGGSQRPERNLQARWCCVTVRPRKGPASSGLASLRRRLNNQPVKKKVPSAQPRPANGSWMRKKPQRRAGPGETKSRPNPPRMGTSPQHLCPRHSEWRAIGWGRMTGGPC